MSGARDGESGPHEGAPVERPAVLEATYRVRFDEATAGGDLRGSALLGYLQDIAWRHSEAFHFPRAWYAERGLAWLARAVDLVLLAPAGPGDEISVDTRVGGWRRVMARRVSFVRGADGTILGRAIVDWAMTDGRTVVRIPDDFAAFPATGDGSFTPTRVPLPGTPPQASVTHLRVRRREVDPMGHANNGAYVDWLDEAVAAAGGELLVTAHPRRYRLEYLRPASPGTDLAGTAWADGAGWAYRLAGPDGGELLRSRLDPVSAEEAAAIVGAGSLAERAGEGAASARPGSFDPAHGTR